LTEDTLFSIDIESYLKKIAVFSQRSSLLYPAELVKTAFQRGADAVNIAITGSRVEMFDNGEGIDPSRLNMLADLKRPLPDERKEAAVRALRGEFSAGLLAVFAPDPQSILIETVSRGKGYRLSISPEETALEEGASIPAGSRILIRRKGQDFEREIKIFREYTKWSGKTIVLNGAGIKQETSMPDTLASIVMNGKDSGPAGLCGIPVSGLICRVWITENGVLRKKMDFPPDRGLVYHAVIETENLEWEDARPGIFPYVHKLYQYLCRNYHRVNPAQKDRIEELMFLHTRKTGDRVFSDSIKPFRVSGQNSFLGLPELVKLSNSGKLYVVNSEYNRNDFIRKNSEFTVELKPRQIDFVLNHLRLPARIVDSTGIGRMSFRQKVRMKYHELLFRLQPVWKLGGRRVDTGDLWNEERALISQLNRSFSEDPLISKKSGKVEFHIIKGLGFSPLYLEADEEGLMDSGLHVLLRRKSRLIRKITKLYDTDPRNFELIREFILTELRARSAIV